VVPANEKWYRDLVVARTIADTLEAMAPEYRPPAAGLESVAVGGRGGSPGKPPVRPVWQDGQAGQRREGGTGNSSGRPAMPTGRRADRSAGPGHGRRSIQG
jgi:hypothetical protein